MIESKKRQVLFDYSHFPLMTPPKKHTCFSLFRISPCFFLPKRTRVLLVFRFSRDGSPRKTLVIHSSGKMRGSAFAESYKNAYPIKVDDAVLGMGSTKIE